VILTVMKNLKVSFKQILIKHFACIIFCVVLQVHMATLSPNALMRTCSQPLYVLIKCAGQLCSY
jgi:hypothetical protein